MEAAKPAAPSSGLQDAKADVSDSLSTSALAALQSDVQPVGHDYVEEVSLTSTPVQAAETPFSPERNA